MTCPKCQTLYLGQTTAPRACPTCGYPNPIPAQPPERDFRETTPINDLGPEETPLKERELRG